MAILWILITDIYAVNFRGHKATFYEAEARYHEAEAEKGLEALTSLD